MGGMLIPVVDHEKPRLERGGADDAASRAHRAFQDPHSLHRGSAPSTNDAERDVGQQVVRRGPSGLVKNAKGQWVKPPRGNAPSGAGATARAVGGGSAAAAAFVGHFIPERQWVGTRAGYYFAKGTQGLGYYVDAKAEARGEIEHDGEATWKQTWADLQTSTARGKEARREEARRGGEDRRDALGHDPHDYPGGRGSGGGRGINGEGGDEDRGGYYRQQQHRRDDDDRRRDRRHDNSRDRHQDRGKSRSRSRSRSRDRGGGEDRGRGGDRGGDGREKGRGGGGSGGGNGGSSGGGGGGDGGSAPMTQKEKEAAALARLAAKRSGGGGARVGGIPSARPSGGFQGGSRR